MKNTRQNVILKPAPQGDCFAEAEGSGFELSIVSPELCQNTLLMPPAFRRIDLNEPHPHELYLPEGAGPFPLICFTPILGRLAWLEDLVLERHLSRFFASQGLATLLVERPFFEFDPTRDLHQIQGYLDQAVSRNRKVLDRVLARTDIDSERVGSYGMSFGGIVNALWAAVDDRFKAHVFSVVGGNIPEIILTSRDPLMKNYLRDILKGWTERTGVSLPDPQDLKEALRQAVPRDPLTIISRIPKESTLLVLAVFDHVVRFRYGLAFRKALGNPETVFLPLGHYTSILTIPVIKWKAVSFLKKKLG